MADIYGLSPFNLGVVLVAFGFPFARVLATAFFIVRLCLAHLDSGRGVDT